jgi:hypothetical protein
MYDKSERVQHYIAALILSLPISVPAIYMLIDALF